MGATTFYTLARGKTPDKAFRNAIHQARYDHGHSGYTGTIAEKYDYVLIPSPKKVTSDEQRYQYAEELIRKRDRRVDDKSGPAGCIELSPADNGDRRFYFFGWASE